MNKLLLVILVFIYSWNTLAQELIFWSTQTNNSINSIDLSSNTGQTISLGQNKIRRVRVDQDLEAIFWSAGDLDKIQKADANAQGTNIVDVKTNLVNISTIAVDGSNNKVYYHLGNGTQIFSCDTLGNNATSLINFGAATSVLGIEIDKSANQIYWTELRASGNAIKRADLPLATNQTTIYTTTDFLFDIKIFPKDSSIYFTNRTGNKVQKIDYNGNNLQTLITEGINDDIGSISGDYCNNVIYYINSNTGPSNNRGRIRRADLSGGNLTTVLDTSISFLGGVDVLYDFYLGEENNFLGADQTLCVGDSVVLNATTRGANYIWSDNSSSSTLTVKQSGTYHVTVSNNICSKTDTVIIVDQLPTNFQLPNDTNICFGDTVYLDVTNPMATYLWSTHSVSPSIKVSQSGVYWVDLTINGCTERDSIVINVTQTNKHIGNDTTVYIGDSLLLDASTPTATYLWSDNSTNSTLKVKTAGIYWVDITIGNCTERDSITINFIPAPVTLNGIINEYAKVNSIGSSSCSDTLFVNDTTGFTNISKLLIIQMQGAGVDLTNNVNFGDIVNINDAGNYEFAGIHFVGSNFVVLESPLTQSYTISGNVQIVTVPTYQSIVITNSLTAKKWDGNEGGILAMNVIDTLKLEGSINLDSCGFRKGLTYTGAGYGFNSSFCGVTDYAKPVGNFNGGQKGEGIAAAVNTLNYGRGHFANGGGGGNSHNSGGGGGGNYGPGGIGGREWINCSSSLVGGIGGVFLPYSNTNSKVFLGGGGGAGDSNGSSGTDGGNGGGIIFIKSKVVISNNKSITAIGESAATSGSDGAGGAGAGGSILFDVDTVIGNLTLNVNGGKGGDMNNAGSCVGPGGGGGGGYVNYSSSSILPNTGIAVFGGLSGRSINSANSCFNTSYGAQGGSPGNIFSNLNTLFVTSVNALAINLGPDTTVCFGDSILLNATTPSATYLWSDNSTGPTLQANQSGVYWVEVTTGSCTVRDFITVTINPDFNVNLGADTLLCFGDSLILDATTTNATYLWSNNATSPTIKVGQAGLFFVDVTVDGCTKRDSITVSVTANVSQFLGNDTALCVGDTIAFNLTLPGYTYLWSDGSTNSTFVIRNPGTYWLDLTTNNCTTRDFITVTQFTTNLVNLGNDTALCFGDSIILSVPNNLGSILWSTGETTPNIVVKSSGTYTVLANLIDCTISDTINISFSPEINNLYLGNDTTICEGDSISYNLTLPGFSYAWSDGSQLPEFTIKNSGTYYLDLTKDGCTVRDSISVNTKIKPLVNLGSDTTICEGDSVGVKVANNSANYLWNTGALIPSIEVLSSGVYWLEAIQDGCINRDSIIINTIPKPVVNLGSDTILCEPDTVVLNAFNQNASYAWNNGTIQPDLQVTSAGVYSVSVELNGCVKTDEINIQYINNKLLSLGNDTTLCIGEIITIGSNVLNSNYLWNTGQITPSIIASDSGLYSLEITNVCGSANDSIYLDKEDCNCEVSIPNIFTPNGDGINDALSPMVTCELKSFQLSIYNRWGDKVFESNNPNIQWDGRVHGRNAQNGAYTYLLDYKFINDVNKQKSGVIVIAD